MISKELLEEILGQLKSKLDDMGDDDDVLQSGNYSTKECYYFGTQYGKIVGKIQLVEQLLKELNK